jgi:hypothetical protein
MRHSHTDQDRVLEVEVVPRVFRFAADDPRSLDEVAELHDALRSVVTVRTPPAPAGAKGPGAAVNAFLIALAALNPIGGIVEIIKAWLNRDRTRRLDLSWNTPKGKGELHLSATGVDLGPDELRQWLEEARNQFSEDG